MLLTSLTILAAHYYSINPDETVSLSGILKAAFGGIPLGYNLKDGIPFSYLIYSLQISAVSACAIFHKNTYWIMYMGIKKYWAMRSRMLIVRVLFLALVIISVDICYCWVTGNEIDMIRAESVFWEIFTGILPAMLAWVGLLSVLSLFVYPALVVLLNQFVLFFLLGIKGPIPFFDHMMLYRIGSTESLLEKSGFLLLCLLVWIVGFYRGYKSLKKRDIDLS